ncbi:leucine-rich melanocyte differentiation-associated protein [Rhipicephalus microplus]|uniref:leucine-rich melanocyte differentiation-associated protein n=1 Tax=Rhipicephalus microplus TaxID=6941 RepID=UPI0018887F8A|nr:leucine-rich melanocyte differentiation-associated protein-like [Rhipicephalus microplus]
MFLRGASTATAPIAAPEVSCWAMAASFAHRGPSDGSSVFEPYRNGDISCVGHDCRTIPDRLVHAYAFAAYRLDLSYNRLTTIQGIEHFVQLRELVLDNNELRDASEFRFNAQLSTLSLNKNYFDNLDYLVSCIQQCYPSLTFLSLLGNPACPDQISNPDRDDDEDYQRYRYYVIHKLRQLKFLDSRAVTSVERAEAMRVGAFMRVARPPLHFAGLAPWADSDDERDAYTPLPLTPGVGHQHKTVYGMLKYKYTGKHSEGNRFIRNDEL